MVLNLCSWVFLLRQKQGLNYTKIQEIKGYLVLWTNFEFRKLVQNVAQWVDQNVQAEFRRSVLHKPRNSRTLSRTCKSYVTWINVQESTFAWINQAIKTFVRLMAKKKFNVHLRLWTCEVLGIFQWEYQPRCCNHCTWVMFSLLGLIASNTSLTNGTFWWSECSALHMLYTVNSTIGEKLKSKAKMKILSWSIKGGHIWDMVLYNMLEQNVFKIITFKFWW